MAPQQKAFDFNICLNVLYSWPIKISIDTFSIQWILNSKDNLHIDFLYSQLWSENILLQWGVINAETASSTNLWVFNCERIIYISLFINAQRTPYLQDKAEANLRTGGWGVLLSADF